jgi:hypothetical protein
MEEEEGTKEGCFQLEGEEAKSGKDEAIEEFKLDAEEEPDTDGEVGKERVARPAIKSIEANEEAHYFYRGELASAAFGDHGAVAAMPPPPDPSGLKR